GRPDHARDHRALLLLEPAPQRDRLHMSERTQAWPLQSGALLRALSNRAPVRSLRALVGEGPVFVLAPHPDDESIGCGGRTAAGPAAGIPVFVRLLTDGRTSHPGSEAFPPERMGAIRRQEALRALRVLGVPPQHVRFEGLTDGTVLFYPKEAAAVAARI